MEWIVNGFFARIGWALAEVLPILMVGLIIAAIFAPYAIRSWWRTRRCHHERFFETSTCDAICTDCGKNLGFIGAWQEKIEKKERHDSKA